MKAILGILLLTVLMAGCPASSEEMQRREAEAKPADVQCYSMGTKIVDEKNVKVLSRGSHNITIKRGDTKVEITSDNCVITEK